MKKIDQEVLEATKNMLLKIEPEHIYFFKNPVDFCGMSDKNRFIDSPLIIGVNYQEKHKEGVMLRIILSRLDVLGDSLLNDYHLNRTVNNLAKKFLKIPEVKERISYLIEQTDKTIYKSLHHGSNLLDKIIKEKIKNQGVYKK